MELSTLEIYKKLYDFKPLYNSDYLLQLKNKTEYLLDKFGFDLLEKHSGLENSIYDKHNPLLWETTHALFFIEKHALRHILMDYTYPSFPKITNDIYDSFVLCASERYKAKLVEYEELLVYKQFIFSKLELIIKTMNDVNNTINYMITFVLLHVHMHLESFLFTNQLVYRELPSIYNKKLFPKSDTIIENIMVQIKSGSFTQGHTIKIEGFGFDNEKPSFQRFVHNFWVSKYKISFYEFMNFIKLGAYDEESHWSPNGLRWKKSKKHDFPLYWNITSNNNFTINYFDQLVPIECLYNFPVINVSWYEAEAFANWKKCRLLYEDEWEYMAKRYPIKYETLNIDYRNQYIVKFNEKYTNEDNINELMGSCYEWCQEPIYPYDGFTIDPLYREMSYPFFGFKRICRGASWCTAKELAYPSYRNAQYPDCTKQYIGFRIAI